MQPTAPTANAAPAATTQQTDPRQAHEVGGRLRAALGNLIPAADAISANVQALLAAPPDGVPAAATRARLSLLGAQSLLGDLLWGGEEYAASRGDADARHNLAEMAARRQEQQRAAADRGDQLRRDLGAGQGVPNAGR